MLLAIIVFRIPHGRLSNANPGFFNVRNVTEHLAARRLART